MTVAGYDHLSREDAILIAKINAETIAAQQSEWGAEGDRLRSELRDATFELRELRELICDVVVELPRGHVATVEEILADPDGYGYRRCHREGHDLLCRGHDE